MTSSLRAPVIQDLDALGVRATLVDRLAAFVRQEREYGHRIGRHRPFSSITVNNRLGTRHLPDNIGQRVIAWLVSESHACRTGELASDARHPVQHYVFTDGALLPPEQIAALCFASVLPEKGAPPAAPPAEQEAWQALAMQLASAPRPDRDVLRALIFAAYGTGDRETVRALLMDVREVERTLIDMLGAGV